jgi:hypothetical protein
MLDEREIWPFGQRATGLPPTLWPTLTHLRVLDAV